MQRIYSTIVVEENLHYFDKSTNMTMCTQPEKNRLYINSQTNNHRGTQLH